MHKNGSRSCPTTLWLSLVVLATFVLVPAIEGSSAQPRIPVEEFVSQIYFDGLPLARAASYRDDDVDTLLSMLNDPSQVQFHENTALTLGMIGSGRAVAPLISYIGLPLPTPLSRPAYKGRVAALVGLGYLVNLSGSDEALSYLLESASPDTWRQRDSDTSSGAETARDLSKYSIIGLGMSGHPRASEFLRSLLDDESASVPGTFEAEVQGVATQGLKIHEEISRLGLLQYYQRSEQ